MKPKFGQSLKNLVGSKEWQIEASKKFDTLQKGKLKQWMLAEKTMITPILQTTVTGIMPTFICREMSDKEYELLSGKKPNADNQN